MKYIYLTHFKSFIWFLILGLSLGIGKASHHLFHLDRVDYKGVFFALAATSVVLFLWSLYGFFSLRKEYAKISWLKSKGTPVSAILTAVTRSNNPRALFNIAHAEWINPQDGRKHIFKNELAWAGSKHSELIGKNVIVLIDPRNPDNYLFDLGANDGI